MAVWALWGPFFLQLVLSDFRSRGTARLIINSLIIDFASGTMTLCGMEKK